MIIFYHQLQSHSINSVSVLPDRDLRPKKSFTSFMGSFKKNFLHLGFVRLHAHSYKYELRFVYQFHAWNGDSCYSQAKVGKCEQSNSTIITSSMIIFENYDFQPFSQIAFGSSIRSCMFLSIFTYKDGGFFMFRLGYSSVKDCPKVLENLPRRGY